MSSEVRHIKNTKNINQTLQKRLYGIGPAINYLERYRNLKIKQLAGWKKNGLRRKNSAKPRTKELNASLKTSKTKMISWFSGAMFNLYDMIESLVKKVDARSHKNYYKNPKQHRCSHGPYGFKETSGWKSIKIYKRVGFTRHVVYCT